MCFTYTWLYIYFFKCVSSSIFFDFVKFFYIPDHFKIAIHV
jgi:hypothetical protein